MRTKHLLALLLAVLVATVFLSGCAKVEKSRTKPLLSALDEPELKETLEELFVTDTVYMDSVRRNIRILELCIDYKKSSTGVTESYPMEELRRAVSLYYDNKLPGVWHYAAAGRPRYSETGTVLSEMDNAEFLSTLREHFFLDLEGHSPDLDTVRAFVKELEADPDLDYREIYPSVFENPIELCDEELTIGELRRAVKLYYGYEPYDKHVEKLDIFDSDGKKLMLCEMEKDMLYSVLDELGVLDLFLSDEYEDVIRAQLKSYERNLAIGPTYGYKTGERFLYEELYRAAAIYHSDIYPFISR